MRPSSPAYPSNAQAVAEGDGWSIFIPGLPIAADGATFGEAITEMIDALREYAEDWQDHLHTAPNHADNWGLVHLIALSTDNQLREWLTGDTLMRPSSPSDQRFLIRLFYCGLWERLSTWCYGIRKDGSLRWEIPASPTGWRWVLGKLADKFEQLDALWREKHVIRRVRPRNCWRRVDHGDPEA